MNGIRCAIRFSVDEYGGVFVPYVDKKWFYPWPQCIRIFGSHSEAKRELRNYWLDAYPDAKMVDETEIDG